MFYYLTSFILLLLIYVDLKDPKITVISALVTVSKSVCPFSWGTRLGFTAHLPLNLGLVYAFPRPHVSGGKSYVTFSSGEVSCIQLAIGVQCSPNSMNR